VHTQKHEVCVRHCWIGSMHCRNAVHLWNRCCCNSGRIGSLWSLTVMQAGNDKLYGNGLKFSCLIEITVEYSWKITYFFAVSKVVWQQFVIEVGTFIFFKSPVFFRMCTKNCYNWLIFHGIIQENGRGHFWDTVSGHFPWHLLFSNSYNGNI